MKNINQHPCSILSKIYRLKPLELFILIVFLSFILMSLKISEVNIAVLVDPANGKNAISFLSGLFPPDLSIKFLQMMVTPVLETIQISVAGIFLAILVGLPLSTIAASNLTYTGILHDMENSQKKGLRAIKIIPYLCSRGILNLLRTIPEFIWALLFVRIVGLGPTAGVLAIGVAYGGMLGKIYSEFYESVDVEPLEALLSTGAGKIQVVSYSLLPQVWGDMISYTLYRWECAIRAGAILGLVGAGGIGQQIEISMRMFNYGEVMSLIIIILILVTIADKFSSWIRGYIN